MLEKIKDIILVQIFSSYEKIIQISFNIVPNLFTIINNVLLKPKRMRGKSIA